jgi:hypothetical protein
MQHAKFLNDLEKKLWAAADKLRSTLDAAQYKHAVLGLLFVKYVSDAFDIRRQELIAQFENPEHDYYLNPDDYDSDEEYREEIEAELEIRDYYTEKNVFWVPQLARWETLQNNSKLPPGTKIEIKNGKTATYEIRSVGRLIDDALEAIEKDNPRLKGDDLRCRNHLRPPPQVAPQVTPQVGELLLIIQGDMSRETLQNALGLQDRKSFRERYLKPALAVGLIEMTIPDKPNSRLQKYRLTDKGRQWLTQHGGG